MSRKDRLAYRVHLTPTGTTLATATDTRVHAVAIPTGLPPAERHHAIRDEILDQRVVDPHAFRNHWRIATYIREDACGYNRLRDALVCCRPPTDSDARAYSTIPLRIEDDQTKQYTLAELAVRPVQKHNFEYWRDHTDEFEGHSRACVNEAILRAVADVQPAPVAKFTSEPQAAQRWFIARVTEHRDAIIMQLDNLTA